MSERPTVSWADEAYNSITVAKESLHAYRHEPTIVAVNGVRAQIATAEALLAVEAAIRRLVLIIDLDLNHNPERRA